MPAEQILCTFERLKRAGKNDQTQQIIRGCIPTCLTGQTKSVRLKALREPYEFLQEQLRAGRFMVALFEQESDDLRLVYILYGNLIPSTNWYTRPVVTVWQEKCPEIKIAVNPTHKISYYQRICLPLIVQDVLRARQATVPSWHVRGVVVEWAGNMSPTMTYRELGN